MKRRRVLLLLAIVVVFLPVGVTLSRYVLNLVSDYILEANNFFFSSDKLVEDGITYQVNNWSGVDNFTIQFDLNNMKNNILSSTSDIEYEVSLRCDDDVICTIDNDSGIIYKDERVDNFNVVVTPQRVFDDNESVSITINANSTSPYKKSLTATFVITVGKRGISYEIDDENHQPYLNFTITNAIPSYKLKTDYADSGLDEEISSSSYLLLTDADKEKYYSALVTLTFDPNEVILDTTSSVMGISTKSYTEIDGIAYISSITFNVDASSSTVIRFYKIDATRNYTYPFDNETSIIEFNAQT